MIKYVEKYNRLLMFYLIFGYVLNFEIDSKILIFYKLINEYK